MVSQIVPHIFIIEDEEVNREILVEYLEDMSSECVVEVAVDGAEALEKLEKDPKKFDVILLDRMMPNMDGMAVLKRIKAHPILQHLPVIFQTALATKEDIVEGMKVGAHYYLTKPFDSEMLLSVVRTAVRNRMEFRRMTDEVSTRLSTMCCLTSASFSFKTVKEGKNLAILLANACENAEKSVVGLTELLVNAVEHGNLGITYDEKSTLNVSGTLVDEVERRLELDAYKSKEVTVEFRRNKTTIEIIIKDEGNGFDWHPYLAMSPARALDNHGRGIAMAGMISFDELEYQGCGNTVKAMIKINELRKNAIDF